MNNEQLIEKLVLWIRDKTLAAKCQGVVVGMSGGLDSSVLAVLCYRAFPQNTLGILMPCYSNHEDREHAQAVADQLSLPTKTVILDTVFDALLKVLPHDITAPNLNQLIKANLKVRLRMLTLYYFANRLNYLVAGSSNRSELTIGYFTKYGDGGVDIIPMGNLVKGKVKELANFLGIPQAIISKPPSAGLWPGQTDENELGLSYEELDHYLLTGEISSKLKNRIESLIASTSHKRSPPPLPNL